MQKNRTNRLDIKRESSIDLIKILACLGVVALHTVKLDKGFLNLCVVLVSTISIPLFFMLNGYLMLKKETVSYNYVFRKIFKILSVCFMWEALHAIVYFLYYHQFRNFLESFLLDFFQKGLFFHFWFMGALIILNIFLPFLKFLQNSVPKYYNTLLLVIGIFCVFIDCAMIAYQNQFILNIPQSLRIWNWMLYYMFGGYIAFNKNTLLNKLNSIKNSAKSVLLLVIIGIMVVWQAIIGKYVFGKILIECFYGSLFVIVATLSIFLLFINRDIRNYEKVLSKLASYTMGIYIFHPFILAALKKFIPLFIEGSTAMNLLFWIITVFVCGSITAIINKIPILKELLKL